MSKNQSIKSFFTSSLNTKKEETKTDIGEPIKKEIIEKPKTPAKEKLIKDENEKSAQKRQRKSSPNKSLKDSSSSKENRKSQKKIIKDDDDEDENDDIIIDEKENKKNNKSPKKEIETKSPKLQMTNTDSSENEDSPIKRRTSLSADKKDSKRRKLVIESSSEDDSSSKSTKKNSNSSDEEKTSSKKKKASPKSLPKAKSNIKTSPKDAKTAQKSTKISPNKAKEEVIEVDIKEITKTEIKKESTETVKKEVENSVPKPKSDSSANFFSKSTSNFFGGKKAESTTAGAKQESGNQDEFSPNKENYHPVDDAVWKKDQPVPYKALAQTLYCMEKTTKRLELLSIVSNYFRSLLALSPKDLIPSIYILTNKVAPDYDSLELGIGDTVLFKALGEATGCTVAKLKTEFHNKGDIGLVAEANRCTQKLIFQPKKLTVNAVFTKFKEIASITGNSSQTKKCDLIKGLLVSCDSIEARYLMRSLAGKLRNGLGEQSILQALGHACATTPPLLTPNDELVIDSFKKLRLKDPEEMKAKLEEAVQHVKHAYHQCPNYERVIEAILAHGVDKLEEHCKLTPGVPLKPMLAYPTKGLQEVLKRFDNIEFTCEYKYDGERAQIHILENGSINIYSRNSENNTSKYPDIIEFLKDILKLDKKDSSNENSKKVTSAIIDAEVVAYDTETKVIKPFQVLTTRKRKDVNAAEITVQVCIFAFDLLYLNGQSLINKSFRKRRELLYDYFPPVESKLMYAVNMNSNNLESIQEFLDHSIRDGCEGLMVKTLDVEAHYEISKRSHNWLKLKKDYLDGVGDTLDLVVIGGYLGTGKRTGVYGGYLLAVYNPDEEEYQTICKLGTGLKDDDLQKQFESLTKIKIDKPKSYYRVNDTLEQPDHWFEPEQVWEIKCADFSISPVHTAAFGMVDSGKGISMRFPRYIRLRDDKKPEDSTSAEQLAEMYKNQQQLINQNQNQKTKSDDEEDDEVY